MKSYSDRVSRERKRELRKAIEEVVVKQKKYLLRDYSAVKLAKELDTDIRYVSAVIHSEFDTNYSGLINKYRIHEAVRMFKRKKYNHLTVEQIGTLVGYANRQSFYTSFNAVVGVTPSVFRREEQKKKAESAEIQE